MFSLLSGCSEKDGLKKKETSLFSLKWWRPVYLPTEFLDMLSFDCFHQTVITTGSKTSEKKSFVYPGSSFQRSSRLAALRK